MSTGQHTTRYDTRPSIIIVQQRPATNFGHEMGKHSLRQLFFVMAMIAVGLAIWRLPDGRWTDIPLGALSVAFAVSLAVSATQMRRVLREQPGLTREQSWGLRILVFGFLGTALSLILALIFCELAASRSPLFPPSDIVSYFDAQTLPRDLSILSMLVAIGLQPTIGSPQALTRPRKVVESLALVALTIAIILFWIDRTLLHFLVYIAISGVEVAQQMPLLQLENPAVRLHRFSVLSVLGLALAVANLLLTAGIATFWDRRRAIRTIAGPLAAGLVLESCISAWVATAGISQLSPPMREAISLPPAPVVAAVSTAVLLSAGAFSWRWLARAIQPKLPPLGGNRRLPFHESALASLLVGATSLAYCCESGFAELQGAFNSPLALRWLDWSSYVYAFADDPAKLIGFAATLGGFGQAWLLWRRRNNPIANTLPSIDPVRFMVVVASLTLLAVLSAPILAGAGFSYWSLGL